MAVYMVAWPDKTWSMLVCQSKRTVEELCEFLGPLDATGDPDVASIFLVKREDGEFYCELPSGTEDFPCIHWGDLVPVRLVPPYDAIHSRVEEEVSDG